MKGNAEAVSSASFSPDGKKIVTASFDSTAKIWDAQSMAVLAELKGHAAGVRSAFFSPDGKKIITASFDSTAKIWDAQSGVLLVDLKGHAAVVSSAFFSPDGKRIITASFDSTAKIWDAQSGKLLFDVKGHAAVVSSASFSPDGKKIVTASDDNTAKIWDAQSRVILANLNRHTNKVTSASFSSDGKKIVTASFDSTVKIWDAQSMAVIAELKGHTAGVLSAFFSPDGKKIVTASYDYTTKIWDTQTEAILANLKGHTNSVILASIFVNKKRIVTESFDNIVTIWDGQSGEVLANLKGHTNSVWHASFSPDGKKIVTASFDSTAKIWDAQSGKVLANLKGHTSYVLDASFSPDGKKIITASFDSTAKIWDAQSGEVLANLKGHTSYVSSASFSPDGNKIVTISVDSTTKIWDAQSATVLLELKGHTSYILSASFSPDGKKIVTTSSDNTSKIWDVKSGTVLAELRGHSDWVRSASFSPDGKKIVTTSSDNTSKIWDVKSGTVLAELRGHSDGVVSASFSPDGKMIATVSVDNTAKIWYADKGSLLYTFFTVDSSDYLIVDKDNHYNGTEAARKLLYFTCGTEIIELEQVKDQLWVPNLAERILKGDSINAKTLDQLNICGLTPEVEDASNKANEYHFKIKPRRGGLGETVLLVNGIEARRYKATELIKNGEVYDLYINKAELKNLFIAGNENPITVKAYTSDNAISSRGLKINEDKTKEAATPPNLYAVMVGVSDYKGDELDLKYASKDATDISAVISSASKNLLNIDGTEHVFMYNLTNNKEHYQLPEKNSIKKLLGDIGKKATANDILLIFFAGHGVMQGKAENKQFYFLTADASQASAASLASEVGISMAELTEWIKPANIKAQKRIMIFDACNSGQAIRDFVTLGNKDQGYAAARNDEKGQEIKAIAKLNEKSGLFILSASASNQNAYEMTRYSQGLLTYALLKAIKQQPDILDDGKYLDVSRWFNAAEKTVSEISKESGARQEPQIVSNTNFNIGIVDDEVIAKIILPTEKPLFASSNFQNGDENILADDLGLNKLIDLQLNEIAARGIEATIAYTSGSNSTDAYTLSGRYTITGNTISIKVLIRQNNEVKHKFDLTGIKDNLKEFAALIASKAAEWASKNK